MPDEGLSAPLIEGLRREGVRDERVLAAVANTPRELFVDAPFVDIAYQNTALPIACGQTISQPYVVAYMTEALALNENARVLEIGTGSGYQAAVLSRLCRRVYTIERHRPLLEAAERRFRALKLENVASRLGDGFSGWPEQAPFDRILLTAAATEVPPTLLEQLKVGGILVGPIGVGPAGDPSLEAESFCQQLTKIIRTDEGLRQEALIPVVFVPMVPGIPVSGSNSSGGQR